MYKSSVSKPLVAFIALGFGGSMAVMLYGRLWMVAGLMLALWLFVMHMLYSITYSISGNLLLIKCGLFYRKTVDIDSIKSVRSTNNLLSSPAASFDRLEIRFNKFDSVIISPERKVQFVDQLLVINPSIIVKLDSR